MSAPFEPRAPRPTRTASLVSPCEPAVGSPVLTVIVPVHNEAATSERLLRRVLVAAQRFAEIVSIEVMGTLARLAEMDHE